MSAATDAARFKARAQKARDAYEESLSKIAAGVSKKLIAPFCKRWGVEFAAGMGIWTFYAPKASPRGKGAPFAPDDFDPNSDDDEDRDFWSFGLPDEFWAEFSAVYEALCELNSHDDLIALGCEDVTAEEG